MRSFVADSSHELRTPLTTITGYLQLDHDGAFEHSAEHDRAIGRALSEAARMRRIVGDLQLLAELDADAPQRSIPVDLATIVSDCVTDVSIVDTARSYAAHVEPRLFVAGDPDRLRQVVSNLVSNVRVHTPTGSTAVVTCTSQDDRVVLSVTDNGGGVPDDELSHVFGRFWRMDRSRTRATGGSGLGLAIVAAIVESHHGTIDASAAPGGGLRIAASFPHAHVDAESGTGRDALVHPHRSVVHGR